MHRPQASEELCASSHAALCPRVSWHENELHVWLQCASMPLLTNMSLLLWFSFWCLPLKPQAPVLCLRYSHSFMLCLCVIYTVWVQPPPYHSLVSFLSKYSLTISTIDSSNHCSKLRSLRKKINVRIFFTFIREIWPRWQSFETDHKNTKNRHIPDTQLNNKTEWQLRRYIYHTTVGHICIFKCVRCLCVILKCIH